MSRSSLNRPGLIKNFLPLFLLFLFLITPVNAGLQTQNQPEDELIPENPEATGPAEVSTPSISQAKIEKIEQFVNTQMKRAKIPGLALSIVKENKTVYQKGYGFSDIKKREPASPSTLFEMASATKFFTGLAILQMEEKGLINLNDPVDKYLPWLKLKYRGQEITLTINHLLHQSTGLQYYETLSAIPPSKKDDALENAVRTLVGKELRSAPGERYTYTSIAYDILGLIIQKVSGQSYEEYMKQNFFKPLQLENTFFSREEAREKCLATGYKICFGKPSAYNAPMYRGNTPAAYAISNVEDLARWLKIQMGTIEVNEFRGELIDKSHVPSTEFNSPNYAAGWLVFPNLHLIMHSGLNPNYSSFVGFGDDKIGVAVLTNMGTMATGGIGQGIISILRGMEPQVAGYDRSTQYDNLSSRLVWILSILLLLNLVLLVFSIFKIIKKKRRFYAKGIGRIIVFIIATVLFLVLIYLISIIPRLLGINVPLGFGFVWMPCSFGIAILWIFLTALFLYLFVLSIIFFPAKNSK